VDNKLLQELRKGDRSAQRSLYLAHCDRLMRLVMRYVPETQSAEEVLQDCFLQIFNRIRQFDPAKGAFQSWSAKIAVNAALMHLRKNKRYHFSIDDCKEAEHLASSPVSPEDWEAHIAPYLSKLDERQALVFKLRAVEGFEFEEIKELLGLNTAANSRKLYSLARQRLRSLVDKRAI
jgi:RNA polymerase sigma-70 factor, ECF subfamily